MKSQKKQFIGIKRIWYSDVINEPVTFLSIEQLLKESHEVLNLHQDTWGYEEIDHKSKSYINDLTGQVYHVDNEKNSIPIISFTIGEYSYQEKQDLQGGISITDTGQISDFPENASGWKRSNTYSIIEKSIIAQTKSGIYIILTKAKIVSTGKFVNKNIGLGVTAIPLENDSIGSVFYLSIEKYRYLLLERGSKLLQENGFGIFL